MRILAVTASVFLLALAACSGPDTPVSSGEVPSIEQPRDDAPADGAMLALPPARTVHRDVEDARPRAFESALYDETDNSFHVLFWAGREPCYALGDVVVVETPDTVTVTLYEGHLPGDDIACQDDAQHASVPVTLGEPIGERQLIDGATGDEVVVDLIRMGDVAAR